MDKLRKARSVVRAAFTRTYTTLCHEIKKEETDVDKIKVLFALFKEKTSELEDLNDKAFQLMQDLKKIQEDATMKEIEGVDE